MPTTGLTGVYEYRGDSYCLLRRLLARSQIAVDATLNAVSFSIILPRPGGVAFVGCYLGVSAG